MLGGLGFTELMVILVIVLVLFGAKRVPEIGASIGKGIREFKKSVSDVERQIQEPAREERLAQDTRASERLTTTPEEDRPEPKRLLS